MPIHNSSVNLFGTRVFIGGPIQHAIRPDGFHTPLRQAILQVISVVQESRGTVFSAHAAEKFGGDTAMFTPDQVSVRDFGWMQRCDVFVPVLPTGEHGDLLRTDGTHVELGWASALRKPIVLITPLPMSATASHLLRGLPKVGDVTIVDLAKVVQEPTVLLNVLGTILAPHQTPGLVDVVSAGSVR